MIRSLQMPQNCWLLSHEALQVRAARELRGPILARSGDRERPSVIDTTDGVATISVKGVLTPQPDRESEYYGEPNTTYPELQSALSAAMADKKVKSIVFSVDSPGGAVDGLFALLDDIAEARAGKKPMRVEAENAHSAAYGIAAAVGPIAATSRLASFGSVGVATSAFVLGDMIGKVVHLTNTDSPEKRPEVATPEGRAVVTKYLDQIAAEFTKSIAAGRKASGVDLTEFGRGASMLADAAKSAGLIDSIAPRRSAYARTYLTDARKADNVPNSMAEHTTESENETLELKVAVTAVSALPAEITAQLAELADCKARLALLDAERATRETAERRALITELVALGAEIPATAWVNDAPAPRLASEPLADLKVRVAALRAAKPASAEIRPPSSGSGLGEEALEEFERRDAAKIENPEARKRFVEKRLARKQKHV